LNLTWEVCDGILRHSKGDADWTNDGMAATLEGQLVALCDRIAYSSHDIDDALHTGRLAMTEMPTHLVARLGATHSQRLTAMVGDVIAASQRLEAIRMSPEMTAITNQLKDFMYQNLYLSRSIAPKMRDRIRKVIATLFDYYMAHPEMVPDLNPALPTPMRARIVCDHVAGMTDQFAEKQYTNLMRRKVT
jgi:dGTPase